ncbi:MAG: proline--tRNA ligase [Deltaproteobacteria bacterium]|nr:proline--tRNA ligase [Deltaproteobacteria bacterium]
MRVSKLIGRKTKEKPSEAQLISHIYLLRGGYIRPVANGIYSLMLPAMRITAKIQNIIREEINAIGGQEVKLPVVLPKDSWAKTGRYDEIGPELLRFPDRSGHSMLLAMTHEEAAVDLAKAEVSSYKDFPLMIYQFQTKFRDEPRSRGGLIRLREFTMKDAYSFHTSVADMDSYYNRVSDGYVRIFKRVGLDNIAAISAGSGLMDGNVSQEYMLLSESGEDKIAVCDSCDYKANLEVATANVMHQLEPELELKEVYTPNLKTIADLASFLQLPECKLAKMVFYRTTEGKIVAALIRGDLEVNEHKLSRFLNTSIVAASEEDILSIGAVTGFASGMGLRNCILLADYSIERSSNLVCGANKPDYHYLNFNLHRDAPDAKIIDLAIPREGDLCPMCAGGKLSIRRGIEVGNIFKLGVIYTEKLKMSFTDETGQDKHPLLCSYGIGIERLLASIIEESHDQFGPIWPISVTPWQVQLNAIQIDNELVHTCAEQLYEALTQAGIEVLYDDRNLSAGVQFAEADLMGIPLRLIVSTKNLQNDQIEYKIRGTQDKGVIAIHAATSFVQDWLKQHLS